MNEEPGFADEVVMVFGDGEVVDGFLACKHLIFREFSF
jgi:hypothetical protein